VKKGEAAPVDSVLCILGEKGEDYKKLLAEAEKNAKKEEKEEKVEEKVAAPVAAVASAPAAPKASAPAATAAPAPVAVSMPSSIGNGRVIASPLAKRLAEERGINISFVPGSGDGGRVVKRDIENYQGGGSTFVGTESFSEVAVSQMRKVIASRLAESKFTAPHFYLTIEIDMDQAIEARKSINASITPQKISFNDLVVKAAAKSLRKHPAVNSSWLGDRIRYNDHIHIGVAVAVDEGLLVPVVRFADGKRLTQIGAEVKDMASKAKAKKLQPEDWEGNTFTISNLGMFGIDEFTAIINPPDACIMAVGGIAEKPVVKNGQIVPGNIMKVTLSCDHRVVDGVVGSSFLSTFREYLENPVLLLGESSI
jgi:pyruvate dehydrogenase E2 component (dihydrolipoamide acetyltransferase)